MVLLRGRKEIREKRDDLMTDAEAGMMHFEDRRRSHKPRNKWPLEAEKGKETNYLPEPLKRNQLCSTETSDLQTCKKEF